MPQMGVSEPEVKQLVAFLKWVATIENRHWPPQDEKYVKAYQLREARAQQLNKVDIVLGACGGCHSFENQGRNVAGDFSEIAKRIDYDRETLIRYILDPQAVKPGVGMPPQNLSRETAALIADFVLSLKIPREPREVNR
jgi:mono/diheme cytochrome c family protein